MLDLATGSIALLVLGLMGQVVMDKEAVTPFTAMYEESRVTRLADGSEKEEYREGRIYRDKYGRTRDEFVFGQSPMAFLYDSASDVVVALDLSSGETVAGRFDENDPRNIQEAARRKASIPSVSGLGRSSPTLVPVNSLEKVEPEWLGERVIEGLLCKGKRLRFSNGGVVEDWFSHELPDKPLIHTWSGPSRHGESKLTQVKLGKPDPELFKLLETVGHK
jgi:hypothetical protein